jgi:hypothetical protein
LAPGPASAIHPARDGCRSAQRRSYGALAKPSGHPVTRTDSRGITTIPTGSRWMWGMGSRVPWPPSYAVRSPPRMAAQAWAASWSVTEKRNTR